ncbi:hypothetical protein F5Y19DRAFT_347127 [Xylariaceae sp. FL1651]|nr:hypothetical protein F5Y19DRAFT_347127 [Xylariaceae sp. FL1651]
MTDAVTTSAHDKSGIWFCDLCNKPIASEKSYTRHIAYCRKSLAKPKKRKRSCKQCHSAKARCSFEPNCARCINRGFVCEYEKPVAASTNDETNSEQQDVSMSESPGTSPRDSANSLTSIYSYLAEPCDINSTVVSGTIRPPPLAAEIRADPVNQASIAFLLENIRALPLMMRRRETFPAFIHGHFHVPRLPETILNCQRISQLYVDKDKSPLDRKAFDSAQNKEIARLMRQLPAPSQQECLAGLQAQLVYNLASAFDVDDTVQANSVPAIQSERLGDNLVTGYARECFHSDNYVPFDVDKIGNPDETWEDFIYAESRRRCALFWFLASRVIDLKSGNICPPIHGYLGLALPSPESLWKARTRKEWETARMEIQAQDDQLVPDTTLRTFGELVAARSRSFDKNRGQQVAKWLAGCDKLGLMLLVASTLV